MPKNQIPKKPSNFCREYIVSVVAWQKTISCIPRAETWVVQYAIIKRERRAEKKETSIVIPRASSIVDDGKIRRWSEKPNLKWTLATRKYLDAQPKWNKLCENEGIYTILAISKPHTPSAAPAVTQQSNLEPPKLLPSIFDTERARGYEQSSA